jgi:hypothetical protein
MEQNLHAVRSEPAAHHGQLEAIRHHMAEALIGRTVGVISRGKRVTHGVVTGVINEDGVDKLVVGHHEYDLTQLLTVLPPPVR